MFSNFFFKVMWQMCKTISKKTRKTVLSKIGNGVKMFLFSITDMINFEFVSLFHWLYKEF